MFLGVGLAAATLIGLAVSGTVTFLAGHERIVAALSTGSTPMISDENRPLEQCVCASPAQRVEPLSPGKLPPPADAFLRSRGGLL